MFGCLLHLAFSHIWPWPAILVPTPPSHIHHLIQSTVPTLPSHICHLIQSTVPTPPSHFHHLIQSAVLVLRHHDQVPTTNPRPSSEPTPRSGIQQSYINNPFYQGQLLAGQLREVKKQGSLEVSYSSTNGTTSISYKVNCFHNGGHKLP